MVDAATEKINLKIEKGYSRDHGTPVSAMVKERHLRLEWPFLRLRSINDTKRIK
jgi:hypothetical protein